MSMTISHGCYKGSFGAFHAWRTALGQIIGVQMPQVEHNPPYGLIVNVPPPGISTPQDDLLILLDHPDDRGSIAPGDCLKLAVRLEQLIPFVGDFYEELTQEFIDGLRLAASRQEPVRFNINEYADEGSQDDEREDEGEHRVQAEDLVHIQVLIDDLFSEE